MTENEKKQIQTNNRELSSESNKEQVSHLTRRQALLGALFAGAVASKAEAADVACSCLPAPDCNAVCPNGGSPKGDGTQACECFENPPPPTLHPVAYSGDYNALANRPNRAGSDSDGGPARNSIQWNGHQLRKQYNKNAAQIPVFSGSYIDYVNKSDLVGTLPVIGAKVLYGKNVLLTESTSQRPGYNYYRSNIPAVKRDQYGRVEAVGYAAVWTQCNCNCCNCGDDSNCFIQARLKTLDGFKSVENISVGDKLVGIDGISTVISIVTGVLGQRKAIAPLGTKKLILTEEHIVLSQGMPTSYCETGITKGKKEIESQDGIKGVYVKPWLEKLIKVESSAFNSISLPQETPTYTFIVDKGCWGMTAEGISVLLCEKC